MVSQSACITLPNFRNGNISHYILVVQIIDSPKKSQYYSNTAWDIGYLGDQRKKFCIENPLAPVSFALKDW